MGLENRLLTNQIRLPRKHHDRPIAFSEVGFLLLTWFHNYFIRGAPGGGHSHSGGDAYVRLLRPPFFSIALTQRPHIFHNLTQRPNIFFLQKMSAVTESPPFFQTIWNFSRKDAQFLTKTSKTSEIFWNFHRMATKFWQFWVTLAYSHPMPPYFFLFALTECPWVRKSQPYTHIHFILKYPPLPLSSGENEKCILES